MKHLLLFLCFLYSCNTSAQTVFAPPGAVWHFEYTKDLDPPGLNYTRQEVIKDTVFEGRLCSKIIGTKISINSAENGYDTIVLSAQYTYISDDTVYYYNHNFSRFYPLYIYNVKVGDTVTYHVPYLRPPSTDTTFKVIVYSIDEMIIDGQKLKRIEHLDYYSSIFNLEVLTERLGADGESIIGYQEFPRLPDAASIRCYQDRDIDTNIGLWKYDCEELKPLGLLEHRGDRNIILYPNPAQEWVSLEYPEGYVSAQYRVTDIMGRVQPVPMRLSAGAATFDLRSLPPGLYHLQALWPDGSSGRAKFVKSAY